MQRRTQGIAWSLNSTETFAAGSEMAGARRIHSAEEGCAFTSVLMCDAGAHRQQVTRGEVTFPVAFRRLIRSVS